MKLRLFSGLAALALAAALVPLACLRRIHILLFAVNLAGIDILVKAAERIGIDIHKAFLCLLRL